MNHFLDLNATDLARARTVSLLNQLASPFPVLTVGSSSQHNFFVTQDGALSGMSGDPTSTLRVTVGDVASGPTQGVTSLTVGNTAPIEVGWDIDAAGLQNALNSNATIEAEGGVDVSQQQPGQFLIAYREVGGVSDITVSATKLIPQCTATILVLNEGAGPGQDDECQLVMLTIARASAFSSTDFSVISIPYAGWQGYIDLTSAAAMELVRMNGERRGAFIECTTLITIEVIDVIGNVTPVYQSPLLLRALNYSSETTTPTVTQYFFSKPSIVGLASNSSNATLLGGLTTASNVYPIGCTVQCQFSNDVLANFVRKGTTANQSVPFIVRPFDYNNATNPYQWVLGSVSKQGTPATYDADTGLWTYIVTTGNANAISVASDQTGFSLPS